MKPHFLFLPPAVLLLSSCGSEPPKRAAQMSTAPVITVSTSAVSAQDWPATYETTGTVRARITATIASKVTGYVQQVHVQVGDHVQAGQLLIALDSRDLDAAVRHAEAARTAVESSIPELESAIAAAKANLDLAQITFKRMEELASKKSISNQEMDEAAARLKAAQANYEMARARRVQLNSQVAQVQQEVRSATIVRDYARISAPFAGEIVAKSVEQGNLATPGVPLLTIEQSGAYRLEASVEESKLSSLRTGQTAGVTIGDALPKLTARISEIVPAVDPVSRAGIVKLDLPPNPRLRTGMFGRAAFPLGSEKVLAVPTAAVIQRGQLQSVFVVENGVAHTRLVTTGRRSSDSVELLSGLNLGERIVPTSAGLQDGARVEVRQ